MLDRLASLEDQLESGELVRVVHAEWREDTGPADGDLRCTHCRVAWPECAKDAIAEQCIGTMQTLFKYCPQCGAKMDGDLK